ncbi:histidine kinase [Oxynema sp. CENA135]|uniref:histidine kinase n=1 Tax=Oxynema sp. CENA135 TaxID=984206 RepID=UPI00190B2587|nr:histidine kinase [Oxynema sp. CENA135]MBK4729259.1 histidine kinase [Oxynema sp. CENA135]
MSVSIEHPANTLESPLQLLLFVDRRPSSREHIRRIRSYLKAVETDPPFDLQVIDVAEQPYLAEHFKLVATPALIKIHPEPRETLAGTNLVPQLEKCWPRWQRAVAEYLNQRAPLESESENSSENNHHSWGYSAELIRLSDEIFRLKQENEDLSQQLQFKDRLITMLAHDLRNPLTATSIALETLDNHCCSEQADVATNPKLVARLIGHARNQTRLIEQMISDLLQAERSHKSDFRIHPQKLDLNALCHRVIGDLDDLFRSKSQQIETDIPSDLPPVYADGERIRQVLVNLLDNAIKYTPEEGKIEIAILHRTTQKVQVSIFDNGPGIPSENQSHIFEDRFRLKRDQNLDGYGIGLSLCKRLIVAHYGQIWVDSSLNKGSAFHFTLPVYRR